MYDQIAHLYDLIHNDFKEDFAFLIKVAAEKEDPILELGCGTGRLLIFFSRVGHQITGIDNSTAMLEIARGKLDKESEFVRERITLVEGDIVSFGLEQQFGLVILPINTLFHLDRASRRSSFKCIYRHLHPGGQLAIDIDNPTEMADPVDDGVLLLERSMQEPGSNQIILQKSSSWVNTDSQQRHVTWIFDATPLTGGSIQRTIVTNVFHYVNAYEIEQELGNAGLILKAFYGDYDRSPFNEESPRLLVIAEKPT